MRDAYTNSGDIWSASSWMTHAEIGPTFHRQEWISNPTDPSPPSLEKLGVLLVFALVLSS